MGAFIRELVGRFALILIFLRLQFLLLVLKHPPLVLFLPDIALDAEHKQYLLPQLVIQLYILSVCDDLVGDVHAL